MPNLEDINQILIAEIKKLTESKLNEEDLDKEIKKTKAINEVAKTISNNAKLQIDAAKITLAYGEQATKAMGKTLAIGAPDEEKS